MRLPSKRRKRTKVGRVERKKTQWRAVYRGPSREGVVTVQTRHPSTARGHLRAPTTSRTIRNVLWYSHPRATSASELRELTLSPLEPMTYHLRLDFVNRLRTQRTFRFPRVTFQAVGIDNHGNRVVLRRDKASNV